eukprot:TRINITY_DN47709_c0_g1_i2.p1 TRINITY_DN47709_c0_g1~~TRINITY_DN47709_c0_g1_i2.p1  ORF type:complete len:207 (-),score=22.61 TRINITY_DN47709_c0_g1_i2:516-1136(-)
MTCVIDAVFDDGPAVSQAGTAITFKEVTGSVRIVAQCSQRSFLHPQDTIQMPFESAVGAALEQARAEGADMVGILLPPGFSGYGGMLDVLVRLLNGHGAPGFEAVHLCCIDEYEYEYGHCVRGGNLVPDCDALVLEGELLTVRDSFTYTPSLRSNDDMPTDVSGSSSPDRKDLEETLQELHVALGQMKQLQEKVAELERDLASQGH